MGALVIGAIRIDLGMETSAFTKGATQAQKQTEALGKKMQGFGKTMMGVGAIMTAASATVVAGLVSITKKGLEYASALGETAQQLGVTTDELQQFRYAASQVGIEQSVMDKGLAKLTVTIGKAAAGSKPLMKQFSDLGISLTDSAGRVKTVGQIMPELAEALGKIEDPAKRAAIEVALLGKAGQSFDTLFAGGAAELNKLTNAAKELGLVLTPEQIAKADEAADKFAALQQVLSAKIAGVVADNSDAILAFVEGLAGAIDDLVSFFTAIGPEMTKFLLGAIAIAGALGPVLVAIGGLTTIFGALLPILAPIAVAIGAVAASMSALLLSLLPILIPLAAIVAAWYYWDEIVPIVERVGKAVSDWYKVNIKPTIDAALATIKPLVDFFINFFGPQITGALDIVSALLKGDFSGAFTAASKMAQAMGRAVLQIFQSLAPGVIASAKAMYDGVRIWIQDKLGAVFTWLGNKVSEVKGFFFGLYDAVVGHSYIPDMVDGIGAHMARLQATMVDPASAATKKTSEAFRKMADEIGPLLERLFPEAAAENQYKAEEALIDKAEKAGKSKGGISADQAAAARQRLKEEKYGDPIAVTAGAADEELGRVEDELKQYIDVLNKELVIPTEKLTTDVVASFADMAEGIIFSLDGMIQDFKRGDILGGIMGMLQLIGQVADLVAGISGKPNSFQGFGKQPTAPSSGVARAAGGPVVPGKVYRVGEKGPEFFEPGGRGTIHPANGNGRGSTYHISGNLLTPDFWDKIQAMDDVAAAKGAMGGASMVQETSARRSRQRLGR